MMVGKGGMAASVSGFGDGCENTLVEALATCKWNLSQCKEGVVEMSTYTQGYALVNGLNIYYEIHGSGEPLVVLPGGFMTVEAMGELVPQLAQTRQVIGV